MYATVSSLKSLAAVGKLSQQQQQQLDLSSHTRHGSPHGKKSRKTSYGRKALLELVHKKGMENENLCDLKGYEGSFFET